MTAGGNDKDDASVYRRVKEKIYNLLALKGVTVEKDTAVNHTNFCCLKMRRDRPGEATLMIGKFADDFQEMLFIAHEYGHLVHYEKLSPGEAETTYCAIFASNHLGLENISEDGKELVIATEKKASEHALLLLSRFLDEDNMGRVRESYGRWIEGYYKKARLPAADNPFV